MEFIGRLPTITEIVFPREPFVTYETHDAEWAVPLGIAREVTRDIEEGDVVNVRFNELAMRCAVTNIEISDQARDRLRYRVDFDVLSTGSSICRDESSSRRVSSVSRQHVGREMSLTI